MQRYKFSFLLPEPIFVILILGIVPNYANRERPKGEGGVALVQERIIIEEFVWSELP